MSETPMLAETNKAEAEWIDAIVAATQLDEFTVRAVLNQLAPSVYAIAIVAQHMGPITSSLEGLNDTANALAVINDHLNKAHPVAEQLAGALVRNAAIEAMFADYLTGPIDDLDAIGTPAKRITA